MDVAVHTIGSSTVVHIADTDTTLQVASATSITEIEVVGGPPGPAGSGGGAATIVRQAAGEIGGHRGIAVNGSQQAVYADPGSSLRLVGVSAAAATAGTDLPIQTAGEMTESSWTWVTGSPVWLSSNGGLTQTVPGNGRIWLVGTAIAPNAILITPQLIAQT